MRVSRTPPPDFIIVGAPKCGTTSLYYTLKRHPDLFFSEGIKEPHYFAFDYPARRETVTLRSYDRLFRNALPTQLRGDASVMYLSSTEALPAVLKRRPDTRFIVMVRDPVDMFISFHNELLKSLMEDNPCPEEAWRAQERRARGIDLPRLCSEPSLLQYGHVCSVGKQVERLFATVSPQQCLIMTLDDMRAQPSHTYSSILTFLGVAHDGQTGFAHENGFAQHTSFVIPRLIRAYMLRPSLKELRLALKPILNRFGIRPFAWATKYSLRPTDRPRLSAEFYQELREYFAKDIQLLETLLQRPLISSLQGRHLTNAPADDGPGAELLPALHLDSNRR